MPCADFNSLVELINERREAEVKAIERASRRGQVIE
jgi:hypothetical protein